MDAVTPGTHPEASCGALVKNGAKTSDPLLAALLAEELWRRWDEEGLFNPAAGRHLRDALLTAGAMDTPQALRNYLGHDPVWKGTPDPSFLPAQTLRSDEPAGAGPSWRRRWLR